MEKEYLYLPKVLLSEPSALRAGVRGLSGYDDVRGEMLIYPFLEGSLVLSAVRGLPHDGLFSQLICRGGAASERPDMPSGKELHSCVGELPPFLSCGGFAYSLVYTDSFTPPELYGMSVMICKNPPAQSPDAPPLRVAAGVFRP